MIPGWADTIWSIEVMAPGLVSKGFLIDPPESLPLVLHIHLWDFTNRQDTKWGIFWPRWASWLLPPSYMVLGGILNRNGSDCGAKPGSPSRPVCYFSRICFANWVWQEIELLTYFCLTRFPTAKSEFQNRFETRSTYSHTPPETAVIVNR